MYDIAEQVQDWLADGQDVTVAQVVATRGFSTRDPAEAAAWTDGAQIGTVLPGVDVDSLRDRAPGLHHVDVSDADAHESGLSCGGRATVLVQSAAALGADAWARLAAREPLLVVTSTVTGEARVFTPQTVRDAGGDLPRLFGRGTSLTELVGDDAVVALWPIPTLVVVGDGLIADALVAAAALLGWTARVTADAADAVAAAGTLHRSDALVVLSHDRAVDGPVLAAALAGGAGYVGALGSRRTQAARREWLTDHGVDEADQARIHGPAGLDIDAHTPAEVAVSIVAEILAERGGSTGGALRDRSGPVHVAAVQPQISG